MALGNSGWFTNNFISMNSVAQTPATGMSLLLTSHKIALYASTITPNFDDTLANARYGVGAFATGEVSGTGWAAGGVTVLTAAAGATSLAPTLTVSPAGTVMWDANDISVASTTLTNAACLTFYADAVTAPNADPMLILVVFGGSFSTNNGTFGVQFAAAGISAFDITP